MLGIETIIRLNKFQPRDYQIPFCKAFDEAKVKRFMCIWPRRSGKDICAFNLLLRAALKNVGVYFYCLPTFSGARKIIWDSITNSGQRFLDFIPPELIQSTNSQQMQIKLKNGSLLQLIGSDSYDTALVGTNPKGIIYSEFALADIRAYQYARPILTANEGFACFLSTPRGKNHLWELFQIAQQNPNWFCSKLTIDHTEHIPLQEIEKERHSGEMSEDLILQEYYTSFDMGVEGSYYAKYMDRMRLDRRIGIVPWESAYPVYTSWDLGVRDSNVIIFYQIIGQTIKIIDYYEKNKEGLEHYIKVVNSKPYLYKKHFAPHDIGVTELGTGMTRYEKARQLGLRFEMKRDTDGRLKSAVPHISIIDGIESVRSTLGKIWIDEQNCGKLIKALENYRQEFDIKKRIYKQNPSHDWSSHAADAMRYLCVSLALTKDGSDPAELDRRYSEAMGWQPNMPSVFRDDIQNY